MNYLFTQNAKINQVIQKIMMSMLMIMSLDKVFPKLRNIAL